jgi:hypothetical protein
MTADVAELGAAQEQDERGERDEDQLAGIPDDLRFDLQERTDTDEGRIEFALGPHRLVARKPKEYTMLALASAMSGMADNGDIAYCVMLFCHDAFDGRVRNLVAQLKDTDLYDLIQRLCDKWGEDTSNWKKAGGNREQRRARNKRR